MIGILIFHNVLQVNITLIQVSVSPLLQYLSLFSPFLCDIVIHIISKLSSMYSAIIFAVYSLVSFKKLRRKKKQYSTSLHVYPHIYCPHCSSFLPLLLHYCLESFSFNLRTSFGVFYRAALLAMCFLSIIYLGMFLFCLHF